MYFMHSIQWHVAVNNPHLHKVEEISDESSTQDQHIEAHTILRAKDIGLNNGTSGHRHCPCQHLPTHNGVESIIIIIIRNGVNDHYLIFFVCI